jgi:hypothetical protein
MESNHISSGDHTGNAKTSLDVTISCMEVMFIDCGGFVGSSHSFSINGWRWLIVGEFN